MAYGRRAHGVLAGLLLVGMHVLAEAVAAGAPGWLNLVVLVLAWDAIKVGGLALGVVLHRISVAVRQSAGRSSPGPAARFVGLSCV